MPSTDCAHRWRQATERLSAALGSGDAPILRLEAPVILDDREQRMGHALWLRILALNANADGVPTIEAEVLEVAPAEARHPAAITLDLPDCTLLPGLVNAHVHLDLTSIGPQPFDASAGFAGWLAMVREQRPVEPEAISRATARGIALARAAGVVAVGDIAGAPLGSPTLVPWQALRDSPMLGVSFVEFFAIGTREAQRIGGLRALIDEHAPAFRDAGAVRLGLQPHAPNTVGIAAYREAVALAAGLGCPLATHLAESPAEREFIAHGTGPQRALLESVGFWHEAIEVGSGLHPVEHLAPVLRAARDAGCGPMLVAHANDATNRAIELLAVSGATVAYCPRAASYFGFPEQLGPHRWRDMQAAGVPVALGTDSIINLEADAARAETGLFGPLSDARLLAARDGARARELVPMLTTVAAQALGLGPDRFRFTPGSRLCGLVAVPTGRNSAPESIFRTGEPPTLLFSGK